MNTQYDDYHSDWVEKATDYPTKALLVAAMSLFKEQEKRIENHKGKLDGASWRPENWNE